LSPKTVIFQREPTFRKIRNDKNAYPHFTQLSVGQGLPARKYSGGRIQAD